MKNWTKYKTKQININKAVENQAVNELLMIHYDYLHKQLVKTNEDEAIFNDTYLKMTYKYDPNKDFIQQFFYQFNLHKGSYYRYDKCNREISIDKLWGLV